jgi:hypothetical protein
MEDAMANDDDDVMDVVDAGDPGEVLDVVAADRPKKRKKKRSLNIKRPIWDDGRRRGTDAPTILFFTCVGLASLSVLMSMMGFFIPVMAYGGLVFGSLTQLTAAVWLAVLAAEENIGMAIGVFLCLPIQLYFVASNADRAGLPFAICLGSYLLIFLAIGAGAPSPWNWR